MGHDSSPSTTPTDSDMGHQHASHNHNHGHHHGHNHDNGVDHHNHHNNGYEADFAQSGLVSGSYSYMGANPINDMITFDSQEVNFDMLGGFQSLEGGFQSLETIPHWLLPGDVLGGLFEGGMMGASHMG
jgi:hypothetical protein